jgi:hypothetical protein
MDLFLLGRSRQADGEEEPEGKQVAIGSQRADKTRHGKTITECECDDK